MAVARLNPQTSLDEVIVDDPGLEAALEEREKAKEAAGRSRKAYAEKDDATKERIRGMRLGDAPARCGRFVIAQRDVPSRAVSFETQPTSRITIRLAKDTF